MKTYNLSFEGRQNGAIGIFYKIHETYSAKDIHEVMSLLYEDYEHIKGLIVKQGNKEIEIPKNIKWVKVESRYTRQRK